MKQITSPADVVVHYYSKQRCGNGIFYTLEDFIVFYTSLSCPVRKNHLKIVGISLMFNHFHLVGCGDVQRVIRAVSGAERTFTREYNRRYLRYGAMFKTPLGVALKTSRKKALSCIAYVFNNPVAGGLHKRADEYRWSLLAYYMNRNPFSSELRVRECSRAMLKAISIVNSYFNVDKPLTYNVLDKIFDGLDFGESKQMADYIVSIYNFLDYDSLIRIYGTWDNVLAALELCAGDEFELCDEVGNFSIYRSMLAETSAWAGRRIDFNALAQLSDSELNELCAYICVKLNPPLSMLRKFLHSK